MENIKQANHFADREHMTWGLPFENIPQQRLCIHFALQKIFMPLISMLYEYILDQNQVRCCISYTDKCMINFITVLISTYAVDDIEIMTLGRFF